MLTDLVTIFSEDREFWCVPGLNESQSLGSAYCNYKTTEGVTDKPWQLLLRWRHSHATHGWLLTGFHLVFRLQINFNEDHKKAGIWLR
jgi:hypothetical protein